MKVSKFEWYYEKTLILFIAIVHSIYCMDILHEEHIGYEKLVQVFQKALPDKPAQEKYTCTHRQYIAVFSVTRSLVWLVLGSID